MSKINNTTDYPITTPAVGDILIGTDVSNTTNDVNGETVNFNALEVSKLVIPTGGTTGQVLAKASATNHDIVWSDSSTVIRAADGTVSDPSIAFSLDANTGFFRPDVDQIGMGTGGVQRALLSSAALEINVPVTGTAAQANSTDTTNGRLFKMNGSTGCFGLGAQGTIISDFSTLPAYSQFLSGGGSGTTDGPPDSGAFRPGIACYRANSDRLAALMFTTGGVAVRNYTAGVAETSWNKVFTQQSVLGTVSQSAGVPTGALIERGSNANGEYVRFADGTQICTRRFGTAATSHAWTFPASFISASGNELVFSALARASASGGIRIITENFDISAASVTFNVWDIAGAAASQQIFVTAIGRWF